jgi:hypothetical protein
MRMYVATIVLLLFGGGALRAQTYDGSLSVAQLQNFTKSLQTSEGRIYAIIPFLDESAGGTTSIAVLTARPRDGWRVAVFASDRKSSFRKIWSSGKLDDSFAVSSASQLAVFGLESGYAISFGGCAAHMCPEIFSELLYVPSMKRAYSATCQDGTVHYSFAVSDEKNADVKSGLDELLRNHSHDKNACGANF